MFLFTENCTKKDLDRTVREELGRLGRTDANETLYFSRQLEYIYTTPYNVLYPDLKARSLFPVDSSVAPGATSHTYNTFDMYGKAKIVNDWANDFPNIEVNGKQTQSFITSIGDSYGYSYQDIWTSQFAGMPLESMKSVAARRIIENKIEDLAAYGDATLGAGLSTGFTNAAGITAVTAVTKGAGGLTWTVATPDEIVTDLINLVNQSFLTSKQAFTSTQILLDTVGWTIFNSKPQSPTFKGLTIAQYFKELQPEVNVASWNRLDTAGASSKARIMAYPKRADVASMVIPMDFFQAPPQVAGMMWKIHCLSKFGGIKMPYPSVVSYMDGTEP